MTTEAVTCLLIILLLICIVALLFDGSKVTSVVAMHRLRYSPEIPVVATKPIKPVKVRNIIRRKK